MSYAVAIRDLMNDDEDSPRDLFRSTCEIIASNPLQCNFGDYVRWGYFVVSRPVRKLTSEGVKVFAAYKKIAKTVSIVVLFGSLCGVKGSPC